MTCPNCGATLIERDRAGIKIDFCGECKGVWLDRGELDKIIQRELADAEPAERDDYVASGRDRDRGRDSGEYREREVHEYERKKKSKKSTFFESLTEMMGGGEAD